MGAIQVVDLQNHYFSSLILTNNPFINCYHIWEKVNFILLFNK